MIRRIITALCFVAIIGSGFAQTSTAWQKDLRFLQERVHKDYSNLFYNITAEEWDKSVESFYNKIPGLTRPEVLAGFVKLVAVFRVGHTLANIYSLDRDGGDFQVSRYPIQFYMFNDGLYILRTTDEYEKALGGKVTQIGKTKVADALEAIRPLVPYENEQGFKANSMYFLSVAEFLKTEAIAGSSEEIPITYLKNDKAETMVFKAKGDNTFSRTGLETNPGWVEARKPGSRPLWQKEPSSFRYMEYLPDSKTLYVRHSVTLNDGDKTIVSFFDSMVDFIDKNDVDRLVLDIRMNGGGNNYLNKAIITGIIKSRKINRQGKFFCILGRRTFSAAQNLVNELEKYTQVIFVGEPASENVNFFGDTKTETLPNSKLQVNLSWLWWQNSDPRDKRKATSPSIAAMMNFDDYYNNTDPAMKAILDYDKQKPFLISLIELTKNPDKREALKFAMVYRDDPKNQFIQDRIEDEINEAGYERMQKSELTLANTLLEINMKLFPESANVYDSYAESLTYLSRKEEAIKYYEMAIAKDKEGVTAGNARKMIEKLKGN